MALTALMDGIIWTALMDGIIWMALMDDINVNGWHSLIDGINGRQ
jgi:hypothetical protein